MSETSRKEVMAKEVLFMESEREMYARNFRKRQKKAEENLASSRGKSALHQRQCAEISATMNYWWNILVSVKNGLSIDLKDEAMKLAEMEEKNG